MPTKIEILAPNLATGSLVAEFALSTDCVLISYGEAAEPIAAPAKKTKPKPKPAPGKPAPGHDKPANDDHMWILSLGDSCPFRNNTARRRAWEHLVNQLGTRTQAISFAKFGKLLTRGLGIEAKSITAIFRGFQREGLIKK